MAIRRLRLRDRPELLRNDIRSRRQTMIRLVYFTAIIMMAIWLGHVVLGSFFNLRSEGQALADRAVVAVEFPATVRNIKVDVGAGDDWHKRGRLWQQKQGGS